MPPQSSPLNVRRVKTSKWSLTGHNRHHNHPPNNLQSQSTRRVIEARPTNKLRRLKLSRPNSIDEQGRIFQTRSAQAERFTIGFCKLLEPVTDERLRKLFDQDLLALQGKILEILWGNPSQADANAPPKAASSHTNTSNPAQVTEPPKQSPASVTRPVLILAREKNIPAPQRSQG